MVTPGDVANSLLVVGALAIALLVARGMYLIGSGSEAEFEARQQLNGVVGSSGWALLDGLRNAELPTVDRALELLGRENRVQQVRVFHCLQCRHEWTHRGGGWPSCPNCGTERTKQLEEGQKKA